MVEDFLEKLKNENRLRKLPEELPPGAIDLSSNDYLGLGARFAEFLPEFIGKFGKLSFSSSASRLLSSHDSVHKSLESYLSELYNKEALLFNSGWHANTGVIAALANLPKTIFLSDKLIHASVIDGIRASKAVFSRFRHNDMEDLRHLLESHSSEYDRMIVVTEGIFSMDGDCVPLTELVALKREFPSTMIYLDEAHSFGVRGERGLGLAEELSLISEIDFLILTFGKAAASSGAAVLCSGEFKSFFINTSRPFIFSTAIPPVNCAWTMLMISKILEMGDARRRLTDLSDGFKTMIEGFSSAPNPSVSQIIPLLIGDLNALITVADQLRRAGVIALPIRRPTVPPGGERIRFSLSADTPPSAIDIVRDVLTDFRNET